MRILTVTTFFPNAANPQRAVFVHNLVNAMREHCEVDVIAPVAYAPPLGAKPEWKAQRAVPDHETIRGIEVEHPRFIVLPKLGWFSGVGYFLGVLRALRRQLRRGGKLIIHAHCAYPDAVGVALAARLLRLPYLVTAHGSDINVYAEQALLRPQIRWALRHAAGVIAVSGAIEAKVMHLIGSAATKVARIPCAAFNPHVFFPHSRQDARTELGIAMSARVVIFAGMLVPIKGIVFLIDAWAELNRRGKLTETDRLVLLGAGAERAALEQRVADAGLGALVTFAGTVNQAEVARWMAAASLLCLPSLNEGTPNVIVEALASGVPVVASRVGGIPDLIRDGENGMLVPPQDAAALAHALDQVMGREWDAQSVAASVSSLTWQAIADRNCEFIQAIL